MSSSVEAHSRDGAPPIRRRREDAGSMPRFMDVHEGFGGVTQSQFEVAATAEDAIQAEDGVRFEHSWLDPESGKLFCLSTGPSKEAVLRIHARAGHPTAEIYEVPIEVS
jgi:hypothetical protein